jgi:2'-5' RNA ligase
MTEEKFVRLNVAFKMPAEIAQAAIELGKKVAEKENVYFTLDGVDFIPHATIYSPEYPEKNLEKVVEIAEKIAKEFSPIEVEFKNIWPNVGWGYVIASFENSDEIKNIHEKIVTSLNPLREGHTRDKDKDALGERKENIEKYGYPTVMNLYDPHITITKLKDENNFEKIVSELDWKIKKFKVDTIMVCIMGEHGTCRKIIKEFKLGN